MENARTANQRSPGQPCARAERPRVRPPLRLGRAVLGFMLLGLGWRFLALGMTPRILPVVIALGGAWLVYEAARARNPLEYEVSPLWICRAGDCRKLSELRAVRLDWYRPGAWRSWRPALLLQVGRETWPLELDLDGWYDVWDCLRELRPDLKLHDWRRHPGVLKLLVHHRRHGVRLPPGVVLHEPHLIAMSVVAGIATVIVSSFVVPALGLTGTAWGLAIESATAILALWVYKSLDPPRLAHVPPPRGSARTPKARSAHVK